MQGSRQNTHPRFKADNQKSRFNFNFFLKTLPASLTGAGIAAVTGDVGSVLGKTAGFRERRNECVRERERRKTKMSSNSRVRHNSRKREKCGREDAVSGQILRRGHQQGTSVREEERVTGSRGFRGANKEGGFQGQRKREKVRDADKG